MVIEVRKFGDPVLKSRATAVKEFDDALYRLADDMLHTMREHEGVGLAANQVGRLKRILVAAVENEEFTIVNPTISSSSEEREVASEGCLSIPGIQVDVERPTAITLTGSNLEGEPVELKVDGLMSRIFQHEIDHLDGVLILDRTDRASRKEAMRELRERLIAQS